MPVPYHRPPPAESTAFARARDVRVCWLLQQHPVTAAMLVGLGWFPTKGKALRRLRVLCRRKKIRRVGTVSRKPGGRPEHVYCGYRPKADSLLHEIELTALCLRLHAGKILRGPHVTAKNLRPDAEVWINGRLYYLEIDRGTMGYRQLERRFRLYEKSADLVLWVCSSGDRMAGMRKRAERVRSVALFTTVEDALANPHGAIWWDFAGNRAALRREGAGGG
jgi:hypothetical protein